MALMGPFPGTETCACAKQICTISVADVTQIRLQLAKLEEAVSKPPPAPVSFYLQTKLGVFIWNSFSNLASNFVWIFLGCFLNKLADIFRFSRAAQEICNYIFRKGLRAGPCTDPAADICEGAMALESPGVREAAAADIKGREEEISLRKKLSRMWEKYCVSEAAAADVKGREEEISLRKKLSRMWAKYCVSEKRPNTEDDTLPVTNCEALSIASHASSDDLKQNTTSSMPCRIGVHLPKATLTVEEAKDLQTQAAKIVLEVFTVESGSTFLSATVWIAASAMENLLQHAVCLLKIGCGRDAACTVQLGNTAILYNSTTTGENVETKLLKEGVHDVPIITSAKKFQERTIVIKGCYLEDTDIKATTSIHGECIQLYVLYHQKLENGVEVLLAQLPKEKPLCEKAYMVHATKTIKMEGSLHPLVLRGKGKKVDYYKQNSSIFGTMCTTRFWMCFLLLCIYQVTILQSEQRLLLEGIIQLFISFLLVYFLVEYIISPWSFGMITHWIEIKTRMKSLHQNLAPTNLLWTNVSVDENFHHSSMSTTHLERDMNNVINTRQLLDDESTSRTTIQTNNQTPAGRVDDLNWEWPCYERFLREGRWETEPVIAKAREKETTMPPFEVMTTVSWDGSESVTLVVCSPLLIQVLKECEPKTGAQFEKGSRIQPEELFFRREGLQSYVAQKSDQVEFSAAASVDQTNETQTIVWYVKHLLRFIERHFADALVNYERMKTEQCVSFQMLWAFFVPGEGVCRRCLITNEECFAVVKHQVTYVVELGEEVARLTLNVMDFNVRSYHGCTMLYKIAHFDGEVPLTSLQVCPLLFFSNSNEMQARFKSVGKVFYKVAMQQPFCFMQFKGSINFYQSEGGCMRLHKRNSDGRVMIDLLSFARMNPDYPLQNATPPCEVMTGMWTPENHMKKPTDEELMLAPAFAYGFSFRCKKWGCFELCGLQEISFNQDAFEALKMKNENQKLILWSVVQQYMVSRDGSRVQNDQRIDLIGTKGTGCIVLCYGPPGTGKTLTAEALAETLKCPLWSVSAFELGEEPDRVETTLTQIMEIAYIWGAILLLDEADAYLERREEGVDVKRNLLTGVFLRVLEYYRGIMFLTTNRVTAFDDAILSRTTLALSYPALEDTQRCEIWKEMLNRVGIHGVTYDALLLHDLNGRQIRNIVHLAQLLAHGRKQALQIHHVLDAMNAFIAGTNDLPGHLLPAASS